MATVKRIPPEPAPELIQITLTEEEALDVRRVLAAATGNASGRLRGLRGRLDAEGITYERSFERDDIL